MIVDAQKTFDVISKMDDDEEKRQALREICLNDLFFLSEMILRNEESEKIPIDADYHGEMCQWLSKKKQRKLLLASRGTLKCLSKDTDVWMKNGTLKTIEEIAVGDKIISFKGLKSSVSTVSAKFYSGKKEVFKLKTNNLKEIKATKDHRFLTEHGWKVLGDIKVGEFVATPRKIHSEDKKTLTLDEVKMLSYMIFEGSLSSSNCRFTNQDKELVDDFKKTCENLGFRCYQNTSDKLVDYRVSTGEKNPRDFFKKYGVYGHTAKTKRIPKEIFSSNVREFLSIMIDTDGFISKGRIGITLANKELISDIQRLFLTLNIQSRYTRHKVNLNGKVFDAFSLSIYGKNVIKFYNEITLRLKQGKLERLYNEIKEKTLNTNVDIIPISIINRYRKLNCHQLLKKGFRHHFVGKASNNISRGKAYALAKIDDNEKIKEYAESDIFWEKVVSIEPDGFEETYDISVDNTYNFVGNGIITHNSTVANRNYAIFEIINNPNITILIVSATLDNSKKKLRAISEVFEKNETFRWLFPELIPGSFGEKWTQTAITVPRTSTAAESTVEVQGYESELTSRHYDLIIDDDVVGKENSRTREQIEKVKNYYTQSLQLLKKPDGRRLIIGTLWNYMDLYNHILENLYEDYDFYIRSCWGNERYIKNASGKWGWIKLQEERTSVYPALMPVEDIYRIKKELEADPLQGLSTFKAQYEMKIVDDKNAIFPRQIYLDTKPVFTDDDLKGVPLAFSLTCDPAVSESAEADKTAIILRAVDNKGIWYVWDVYAKRGMREEDIIEKYIYYLRNYPVDLATVETVAFQKNLKYALEKKCMEEKIFFPYHKLPPGYNTASKNTSDMKIRGISPLYATSKIRFHVDEKGNLYPNQEELLDQLWRFPKASHDDSADALAMHAHLPIHGSIVFIKEEMEIISNNNLDRYGHNNSVSVTGNKLYI